MLYKLIFGNIPVYWLISSIGHFDGQHNTDAGFLSNGITFILFAIVIGVDLICTEIRKSRKP